MSKKTEEKLEVKEIKTYQTSDGKIYDNEEAALEHERLLKNPEEWYKTKILELEAEIAGLSARITALEAKNTYPWSKPNPDVNPWIRRPNPDVTPFGPYQQPFNPMIPSPMLPAQPGNVVYKAGDVVYEDKDHYQRVIMQEDGSMKVTHTAEDDERAIRDGKTVIYCGDKRVVSDNPISENQEYNTGHTGLVYGEMEKRRMEWQRKNKK